MSLCGRTHRESNKNPNPGFIFHVPTQGTKHGPNKERCSGSFLGRFRNRKPTANLEAIRLSSVHPKHLVSTGANKGSPKLMMHLNPQTTHKNWISPHNFEGSNPFLSWNFEGSGRKTMTFLGTPCLLHDRKPTQWIH